jgi:hypothetical protein
VRTVEHKVTNLLAWPMTAVVVGLLGRNVTVAVTEISRGGCLIESEAAIPEGALGTLSVTIDGVVYSEDVRVARCQVVPGGGERHHVGVEYLTLQREGRKSLRVYAASLGEAIARPRGATLN